MSPRIKKQKRQSLPPPPPPEDTSENSANELEVENNAEAADQSDEETIATMEMQVEDDDDSDNGNGLAQPEDSDNNDDDDDDDHIVPVKAKKKRKKGIIYISNIPKHMNVTRVREILGEHGKIGRIYLQPEKLPGDADKKKKKKRKPFARHFTEGWIEFESKRVAKQIVEFLNNKQISSRKKSQFYDYLWSMKYLPRFKWVHLTERMNYEQAVHKQRLMTEVSQARKETTFFQNNLDKSEFIKKTNKKKAKEQPSV